MYFEPPVLLQREVCIKTLTKQEAIMADQSFLDNYYFVDNKVYNCPFCNRRHVSYHIYDYASFDWTGEKECYCYYVKCESCHKRSMHLTFNEDIDVQSVMPRKYRFTTDDLDEHFFYSVPTSFFVLDKRIPRVLRELIIEAEGCLKSNYLTGASACTRKIIYELSVLSKATGDNYEERIRSLKDIYPAIEPVFFDTLLTIQQVTSTKVHESSYDGWEAKHLRIILVALADVLHEIYVVPALREDRRKEILRLKENLTPTPKD